MAKIGLNNLWYSKLLTEASDGTPTYDGAKSVGKAVSASASISNNSATLYADDALAESDTSFQSGTITLGVDDDREATFADLLGHEVQEDEVVRNVNDVAPFVGLARIIVKMVSNVRLYKVEVLYKVKFSEPSQDDNTKGESVEFATPTIEGTIAALANGDWSTSKTFSTKDAAIAYIQSTFAAAGSTFRVVYDANGGTGSVASVNVNVGSSATIAAGTSLTPPSNKVFAGWAFSSTAEAPNLLAGATFTPTADTTLFAVYTAE